MMVFVLSRHIAAPSPRPVWAQCQLLARLEYQHPARPRRSSLRPAKPWLSTRYISAPTLPQGNAYCTALKCQQRADLRSTPSPILKRIFQYDDSDSLMCHKIKINWLCRWRSVVSNWVASRCRSCPRILQFDVHDATRLAAIRAHVFAAEKIHGDDTTVPVLAPGLGRTKTGRLWVYVRDDRPFCGEAPPAAAYFYSSDRTAVHPAAHMATFTGLLQADGYAGFEKLYRPTRTKPGSITEAACWAHTSMERRDGHISPVAQRARPAGGILPYRSSARASSLMVSGMSDTTRWRVRLLYAR